MRGMGIGRGVRVFVVDSVFRGEMGNDSVDLLGLYGVGIFVLLGR